MKTVSDIIVGDVREKLAELPEKSVQCVVTSPPYWGLRDYGVDGQIGAEATIDEYIETMVEVFQGVKRVLRDDGTLWLNMGDAYASTSKGSGGHSEKQDSNKGSYHNGGINCIPTGLKPKNLIGQPWRLAFALQQPYQEPCCVRNEVDRAWLAAMFDGEGCIGIRRFKSYREEKKQIYQDGFVVYTVVTNNDVELLERCIEITGLGKVALKQAAGNKDPRGIVSRRDSYGWRLDGNAAVDVVRAVYPYLIAKKKQAIIAYTLDISNKAGKSLRGWQQPLPPKEQAKRERLKSLINACNQRECVDLPEWCVSPTSKIEPGWYLRSDIIWHKPNPMPESVTDRPTKSHEYIFLLTKNARYFYDVNAVREAHTHPEVSHISTRKSAAAEAAYRGNAPTNLGRAGNHEDGRNLRDVWTIPTQPYAEAHFATFPEKLVRPCLKAGTSSKGCCSECGTPWVRIVERTGGSGKDWNANNRAGGDRLAVGQSASDPMPKDIQRKTIGWKQECKCSSGIGDFHDRDLVCTYSEPQVVPCTVLDPFSGSGTTGLVAKKLGLSYVGIELNPEYAEMSIQRIANSMVGLVKE